MHIVFSSFYFKCFAKEAVCVCVYTLSLKGLFLLKMSYFTSKDETPACWQAGKKTYDMLATCEKMIYIDIGSKSAAS